MFLKLPYHFGRVKIMGAHKPQSNIYVKIVILKVK